MNIVNNSYDWRHTMGFNFRRRLWLAAIIIIFGMWGSYLEELRPGYYSPEHSDTIGHLF